MSDTLKLARKMYSNLQGQMMSSGGQDEENILLIKAELDKLRSTIDHFQKYYSENTQLREALQIIAAPKRADGTYNRSREACEQLAKQALDDNK